MIDDIALTPAEFNHAFTEGARNKFYHGDVPEAELETFRKETVERMIDEILVSREARAQGLKVNEDVIKVELKKYEDRYAHMPEWAAAKERVLGVVRTQLEREQLFASMKKKVEQIPEPAEAEVRAYYDSNRDKFTTPAQDHLWVILLKVPPWESPEFWEKTRVQAQQIHDDIQKGGSFEEWAKRESDDPSAEVGGDLGIRHLGVLTEEAQQALGKVEIGQITPPVFLLEGYGIFRRTSHKDPDPRPFEAVRERAADLLERDLQEKGWKSFLKDLRDRSKIVLYDIPQTAVGS